MMDRLASTVLVTAMLLVSVAHSAPAKLSPSVAPSSPSQADMLLESVSKSNLTNLCEVSQERKDLCERCLHFVTDQQLVYHGCCKNYDGMHSWCEKFLNYSYEDDLGTNKPKEDDSHKAKP